MMKRWLGIDGVDFAIQAAVTIALAAMLSAVSRTHEDFVIPAVFACSLGVLAFRRHLARKSGELGARSQRSGEYDTDLEQRVADLEAAQQRVYELEERVDFAERLLAHQREVERLPESRS